jgi:hypothetical protein
MAVLGGVPLATQVALLAQQNEAKAVEAKASAEASALGPREVPKALIRAVRAELRALLEGNLEDNLEQIGNVTGSMQNPSRFLEKRVLISRGNTESDVEPSPLPPRLPSPKKKCSPRCSSSSSASRGSGTKRPRSAVTDRYVFKNPFGNGGDGVVDSMWTYEVGTTLLDLMGAVKRSRKPFVALTDDSGNPTLVDQNPEVWTL